MFRNDNLQNFLMQNDKCTLVLFFEEKKKNIYGNLEKTLDVIANSPAETNLFIKSRKRNENGAAICNEQEIGTSREKLKEKDHLKETHGAVQERDTLANEKSGATKKEVSDKEKENGSSESKCSTEAKEKSKGNRKKLNIGLDYCTFLMETQYIAIKYIDKGSHFLYWDNGNDDEIYDDEKKKKMAKEFTMNEMKKNSCEEIRNSRFIYFETENNLLVLKYNWEKENFYYEKEDSDLYKQFFHLHNVDIIKDLELNKEKKSVFIYPRTFEKIWKSLTNYINDEVINKIEPVNKTFNSSFQKNIVKEDNNKKKRKSKKKEKNCDNQEEKEKDDDNVLLSSQPYLFFSVIPKYPSIKNFKTRKEEKKRKKEKEQEKREHTEEGENETKIEKSYFECLSAGDKYEKYTPDDLTLLNLEKYWAMKEIIDQEYTYVYYNNEKIAGFKKYENKLFYILGEFQFSFILFHLGFNYESFMQWRKLYELMCNSQKLITDFTDFYKEVLKTISAQLNHLSDDFFDNTDNSFILFGLYNIYDLIQNSKVEEEYKEMTDVIDTIIYTKLGLHLPDLNFIFEEFQPTYLCEE